MKGSLPQDATEAQRQGTAAMITNACILMAGAQNQMGQLAVLAKAMGRDLEIAEREKAVLENERSVLLEKVEHLEMDLLTRQEYDRKLEELKAQMKARVQEAEARGAKKYRSSEDFREEIKRAIAPGSSSVTQGSLSRTVGSSSKRRVLRRPHQPPRLPMPTAEAAARKVSFSCNARSLRLPVTTAWIRRPTMSRKRP
ncbi:uncharacterized protein LOC122085576 [Macadamia integrifolia]|uniref:uncharacterized protein LOC122085576 n=1 Tax=Macadamia integrifolia TaxID=60698 RepID=UPI001C4F4976|nr:uncharacterized protein LOC122085576 [Macadamia integrifolia]